MGLRAVFLADVCSMVVRACVGSLWVNAELREFCDGSCDVLRTLPTLVQQGVKSLGNFTSITLPFISQVFEVFSLVGDKASLSFWTDEHLGKIFAAREFGFVVCLV